MGQALPASLWLCQNRCSFAQFVNKEKHAGLSTGALADKTNFAVQKFLATAFQSITFQTAFK
jgi:hypothetical protein